MKLIDIIKMKEVTTYSFLFVLMLFLSACSGSGSSKETVTLHEEAIPDTRKYTADISMWYCNGLPTNSQRS